MPAIAASRSTASGKLTPSVSMTNLKASPCFPEEKSWKKPFWSLTKKDGVFSALKGDRPRHSRPSFLSRTRWRATSETGSRALISSRKEGENRIFDHRTGRGGDPVVCSFYVLTAAPAIHSRCSARRRIGNHGRENCFTQT